jgi:hypothetical protein
MRWAGIYRQQISDSQVIWAPDTGLSQMFDQKNLWLEWDMRWLKGV